jgi:hypothetical protein
MVIKLQIYSDHFQNCQLHRASNTQCNFQCHWQPYSGLGIIMSKTFWPSTRQLTPTTVLTESASMQYTGHTQVHLSIPKGLACNSSLSWNLQQLEPYSNLDTNIQKPHKRWKDYLGVTLLPTLSDPSDGLTYPINNPSTAVLNSLTTVENNVVLSTSESDCELTDQEFTEYISKFPL